LGGSSTPHVDPAPTQPSSTTTPSPSTESPVAPHGRKGDEDRGASGKKDGPSDGPPQDEGNGKGEGAKQTAAGEESKPSAESDDGVVVTGEVPAAADDAQDDGSPASLLIGLGLLAVLAAGAGLTAWRRSRA